MSNIDFSHIITAEQKAANRAAQRAAALKAECSRRIVAVLDPFTIANIQGAAIAGDLDTERLEQFRKARQWMMAMQQHCRERIAASEGVSEDDIGAGWPSIPREVVVLATEF